MKRMEGMHVSIARSALMRVGGRRNWYRFESVRGVVLMGRKREMKELLRC
jgi:hypothetical protein